MLNSCVRNHVQTSPNFLRMMPVAQSYSGGLVISVFVDDVMFSYCGTNGGMSPSQQHCARAHALLWSTGCVMSWMSPRLEEPLVQRMTGMKYVMHH